MNPLRNFDQFHLQLPVASSTPPTTFFPFPKPIRFKRRSTRLRTRCKDRPIPSPRLLLNEPCRRIDAAKCDPNTPDSKSAGASFEPRNQRTNFCVLKKGVKMLKYKKYAQYFAFTDEN